MVVCIVRSCRNRSGRDKVSFFRIPGGLSLPDDKNSIVYRRRAEWLKRMNANDCNMRHARVCAAHFISGKPSDKNDVDNPDWAPSLNLDSPSSEAAAKTPEIENNTEKPKEKRSKKRSRKRSSSTFWSPPRKRARKPVKIVLPRIKEEPLEETDGNPKECAEIIPSALCEVVITPERRSENRDDDFTLSSNQLRRESRNYSRSNPSNQVLLITKTNASKTPLPSVSDIYSITPSLPRESADEPYRLVPSNSSHNEEHPIETFFRSMARTVMRFPPHLIAEARMMVCSLVSEMEIRAIYEGYPLTE